MLLYESSLAGYGPVTFFLLLARDLGSATGPVVITADQGEIASVPDLEQTITAPAMQPALPDRNSAVRHGDSHRPPRQQVRHSSPFGLAKSCIYRGHSPPAIA